MVDDIEHLKVHKIAPRSTSERVFLPQADHEPLPSTPPTEIYGGSGEPLPEAIDVAAVKERILSAIQEIYDPEIPVNIYDLGLIYGVDVNEDGQAEIQMTLTAPACPVAGALVAEVAEKSGRVEGVSKSHVVLVWDPPWSPDRMTEEAKLELGLI